MKKLFAVALGATTVLALGLLAPVNARAESGSWKDQLANFGAPTGFESDFIDGTTVAEVSALGEELVAAEGSIASSIVLRIGLRGS